MFMYSTENWEPKGKFPAGIRPVLGAVALKAIMLNEYNDNFFNLMPRIFPYNRFTMSVRPIPVWKSPDLCTRNTETYQTPNIP